MAAKGREKLGTETPLSAEPFVPASTNLADLAAAAAACEGCPLFARATQTVFGEGPSSARIVLLGEQPGDAEDLDGRPFVGPAGSLLDRALAAAGLERAGVYVTNAVKHFSWEPRGKRRIHKKPRQSEIKACRPWLDAEVHALRPSVLVCLGATAVQAVLGSGVTIAAARGRAFDTPRGRVLVARHPSAVLRMRTPEERRRAFDELVEDLTLAARLAKRE
ncbi:MAG: UdgX family uracil-DNA binding protein [Acidobacteria bacterium]|nr:UdgX family uracil-DNA binding protein [Acidobacteriota bacterium]